MWVKLEASTLFSVLLILVPNHQCSLAKDGLQLKTEKFSDVLVVKKSTNVVIVCEFVGALRTEWHFGQKNLTGVVDSK